MPGQESTASNGLPQQATVSLRPLKKSDAALLSKWAKTVPAAWCIWAWPTPGEIAWWIRLTLGKARLSVVMLGSEPIGFVGVMDSGRTHIFITELHRRKGYGTAVMRRVMGDYRETGRDSMGVVAYTGCDFYLKLGFKQVTNGRQFNKRDRFSEGTFLKHRVTNYEYTGQRAYCGPGRRPGVNYLEAADGRTT